eukprot:g10253.t1
MAEADAKQAHEVAEKEQIALAAGAEAAEKGFKASDSSEAMKALLEEARAKAEDAEKVKTNAEENAKTLAEEQHKSEQQTKGESSAQAETIAKASMQAEANAKHANEESAKAVSAMQAKREELETKEAEWNAKKAELVEKDNNSTAAAEVTLKANHENHVKKQQELITKSGAQNNQTEEAKKLWDEKWKKKKEELGVKQSQLAATAETAVKAEDAKKQKAREEAIKLNIYQSAVRERVLVYLDTSARTTSIITQTAAGEEVTAATQLTTADLLTVDKVKEQVQKAFSAVLFMGLDPGMILVAPFAAANLTNLGGNYSNPGAATNPYGGPELPNVTNFVNQLQQVSLVAGGEKRLIKSKNTLKMSIATPSQSDGVEKQTGKKVDAEAKKSRRGPSAEMKAHAHATESEIAKAPTLTQLKTIGKVGVQPLLQTTSLSSDVAEGPDLLEDKAEDAESGSKTADHAGGEDSEIETDADSFDGEQVASSDDEEVEVGYEVASSPLRPASSDGGVEGHADEHLAHAAAAAAVRQRMQTIPSFVQLDMARRVLRRPEILSAELAQELGVPEAHLSLGNEDENEAPPYEDADHFLLSSRRPARPAPSFLQEGESAAVRASSRAEAGSGAAQQQTPLIAGAVAPMLADLAAAPVTAPLAVAAPSSAPAANLVPLVQSQSQMQAVAASSAPVASSPTNLLALSREQLAKTQALPAGVVEMPVTIEIMVGPAGYGK